MQRSLVFGLILVLAAILGAAWWFSRGELVPPPSSGTTVEATQSAAPVVSTTTNSLHDATSRHSDRQIVATVAAALRDDPEIQAGLTGWKGRVVDHAKTPVAGCGVRLYRGALDSVMTEGLDLFAEESTFVPQYVAGETKTADDGKFEIHGVWPRAIFVLFAGIGTDAPMHQLVTRTPSPGEVVDLGDIVLPDAGVITGTLLDDNGDPLGGALVRAADLPGTLAAFFPVERFDPEGAVLIREPQSPVRVFEMPKWVKPAFDDLPIPSTRTASDGAFRLVGVVPGSNMLAATARGFLSEVKPSVMVRAGQVKDVGRIKLRRGEELVGRVVDTAGKAVANAQILAGSTLAMAPVDLAQDLGTADAEGRFEGKGFAPGKVTVAARRGRGHPWVLAEPQSVAGDVVVTLPASFAASVTVAFTDGTPVKEPRFRLLQGRAGDGAAEMNLMGFVPAIDLRDRQRSVAEGQWRIENLNAGHYTLIADAPGRAIAFAGFEITTADVAVALRLDEPRVFVVRVVNEADKPIRNARIFAQARPEKLQEMPTACGPTGADGKLSIDKLQGDTLRVTAEHPRWGAVNGEAKLGEELVLRMQPPGSLRGTLRENGKPPEAGKFTLALMRLRGDGPRGPLEDVPRLLTPDLEGTFFVTALQPGRYELTAIKSLDALHSPGGMIGFVQDMRLFRGSQDEQVEIVAGQEATVALDAGEKPIEGPTGTLAGSVTIDGKLATGHVVSCFVEGRRSAARVDERGRFDLGTVPVGDLWVTVESSTEGMMFGMGGSNVWSAQVPLKQAEAKELTIDVTTSSLAGVCVLPDGSPAAGCHVSAQGELEGTGERKGRSWLHASTDAEGRFRFERVPEGTWTVQVQGGHDRKRPVRATLENLKLRSGSPLDSLRIELNDALVVKGHVDVAHFGTPKPKWAWISFQRITTGAAVKERDDQTHYVSIDLDSGEFSTDDVTEGRYRLRVFANYASEQPSREFDAQDIDVPASGIADLQLRPVPAVNQAR